MISTKTLFLLLALVAAMGTASATTITILCSTVSGPTELNTSFACPQFTGVNLQGIAITLNGSINGSVTLINNASVTETGSGTTTSEFLVGPLTGFTIAAPLFSVMLTTGSQSLNAGQTKTFSGLTGSGTATINDTTVLAPYIGSSTFSVPVSTSTGLMVTGGGGNFASSQTTSASATASVVYTFGTINAVPEVSTLAYLGAGFGAILLGLLRRRSH